jgi:hypothetical protein
MAKRSRVSGRPAGRHRPAKSSSGASGRGGRSGSPGVAPSARPGTAGSAAPQPGAAQSGALTESEAQRAAELEAQLLAQEKSAAQARAAVVARSRRLGGRDLDPELANQPLSVRAAREYGYVARDVRRIGLTAALMLTILVALAVAINVAGVIKI